MGGWGGMAAPPGGGGGGESARNRVVGGLDGEMGGRVEKMRGAVRGLGNGREVAVPRGGAGVYLVAGARRRCRSGAPRCVSKSWSLLSRAGGGGGARGAGCRRRCCGAGHPSAARRRGPSSWRPLHPRSTPLRSSNPRIGGGRQRARPGTREDVGVSLGERVCLCLPLRRRVMPRNSARPPGQRVRGLCLPRGALSQVPAPARAARAGGAGMPGCRRRCGRGLQGAGRSRREEPGGEGRASKQRPPLLLSVFRGPGRERWKKR